MSDKTRYPLSWPANWKRTPPRDRTRANFGKTEIRWDNEGNSRYGGKSRLSVAGGIQRISDELRRFRISEDDVLVSTNVQLRLDGLPRSDRGEPSDPGVAIYWKKNGKDQCMAIDRYDRVADNLAAIAATLDAMRAIERHGGAQILERAFLGFAALPGQTMPPWREVFGFPPETRPTREQIEQRFRELARERHPDRGGLHDDMAILNVARELALKATA